MSRKLEPFLAHSELTDCIYIIDGNDKYEVTEQCISAMKSTNRLPRWIPVSEKLPEKEGDYLLWGKVYAGEKEEYPFIGEYDSGYEQFGYWQEQYDKSTLGCIGSDFFEYGKVEAWMPLPEPYKAESEVKV